MMSQYLLLKFFHILIAILALGTSAGLGIALEFYGSTRGGSSATPSFCLQAALRRAGRAHDAGFFTLYQTVFGVRIGSPLGHDALQVQPLAASNSSRGATRSLGRCVSCGQSAVGQWAHRPGSRSAPREASGCSA
jgi:hypothetical protein